MVPENKKISAAVFYEPSTKDGTVGHFVELRLHADGEWQMLDLLEWLVKSSQTDKMCPASVDVRAMLGDAASCGPNVSGGGGKASARSGEPSRTQASAKRARKDAGVSPSLMDITGAAPSVAITSAVAERRLHAPCTSSHGAVTFSSTPEVRGAPSCTCQRFPPTLAATLTHSRRHASRRHRDC